MQTRGYIDGSVIKGLITVPRNIRELDGFINIHINQNSGMVNNHLNLPSFKIWDVYVNPIINK